MTRRAPSTATVVWTNAFDADGNLVTRSETIANQAAASTSFVFDGLNREIREGYIREVKSANHREMLRRNVRGAHRER